MPVEPSLSEILLNWLSVAYYFLASLAIVSAALWAFFKMRIFREFRPSLNLELQIEDLKIGSGKTYILVLLKMTNTSKVQVDFGHSYCSLHEVYQLDESRIDNFQRDIRGGKRKAHSLSGLRLTNAIVVERNSLTEACALLNHKRVSNNSTNS